jgi:hypothetical protein
MKVLTQWVVVAALLASGVAHADVKREIQLQQAAATDLKGLDTGNVVGDEIALLKQWLDEAADRQTKNHSGVRELLDRSAAQVELIRLKLAVAKVKAEAEQREKRAREAKQLREKIQAALKDAIVKKKALEMNNK